MLCLYLLILQYNQMNAEKQSYDLQEFAQQREKRMKIIRKTCTPTRSSSSSIIRKRQQDYESNKKIVVKLVLSKISNFQLKRSNSIPNVHTKQNNEANNSGQVNNQEQEVLSPRKILKNAYTIIPKQQNNKSPRESTHKQKVVIISSPNLESKNHTRTRDLVKAKINRKIESTLKTGTAIDKQKRKMNLQCLTKPIVKKQKLQPFNLAEVQADILERCAKQVEEEIEMENCIMSDVQILKLFPKIDLSFLVKKIQFEQHYRKQQNIRQWTHFAYCNISQ